MGAGAGETEIAFLVTIGVGVTCDLCVAFLIAHCDILSVRLIRSSSRALTSCDVNSLAN